MINGIPANLKRIKPTSEKIINIYFEAFSEKFHVLNLSAINFTGAFNKNELSRVTTTKKKGFKISALYESLFW